MKVSDLKANPGNPRVISDSQLKMLKKSVDKYGDLSGIVFNRTSQQLVGGHQRIKTLPQDAKVVIEKQITKTRTGTVAEGYVLVAGERFRYREVEWDKATEIAANIAANQHGGDWDMEKLTRWVSELCVGGIDTDLLGFSKEELEKQFGGVKKATPGCDEDDVPTPRPRADVKAKPGHIWVLGRHRLMCGDSTKREDVSRLMDGACADMIFTDPPYNVDYDPEARKSYFSKARKEQPLGKIKNDKKTPDAFRAFLDAVYSNINSFLNPGGAIYICHADTEGHHFRNAFIAQPWKLQSCLIWKKTVLVFGRADYHWMHEPILYGWKEGKSHSWFGDRKQTTILEFPTDHYNKKNVDTDGYVHPTQKPVALIEAAISNSSDKNAKVFDLFAGSGSALVACEKSGRSFFGMELDPHYCDVIVARWEKYTGQKAKLVKR